MSGEHGVPIRIRHLLRSWRRSDVVSLFRPAAVAPFARRQTVHGSERARLGYVAAFGILALVTYLVEGPREMNDFDVFRTAADRFVRGHELYVAQDGHFEFKYFPAAAALFAPLCLVPGDAGNVI